MLNLSDDDFRKVLGSVLGVLLFLADGDIDRLRCALANAVENDEFWAGFAIYAEMAPGIAKGVARTVKGDDDN